MKKVLLLVILVSGYQFFAQNPERLNRVSDTGTLPLNTKLAPFYHGVASGDPMSDRVIIWTRITPTEDAVQIVDWIVCTDTTMQNVVAEGKVFTDISLDYTIKVDVTGLNSASTYYYQFLQGDKKSIIGRTKTTPETTASVENLKFAVVSCANYEGGYFNAFGALSKRNDLDAVIHLGDYIYEYEPNGYRNYFLNDPERVTQPFNEAVTLQDYRTRYSLYRLDQNLMFAHQQHPFILIWDDHESANDSYFDGAENHTEGTEGNWFDRKEMSKKAYYEWMPIRDSASSNNKLYRTISYGNLAEVILLDTRLEGREKPPVHFDTPDTMVNFRHIMSDEQMNWMINKMANSTAKWKVIGNQVLFSTMNVGFGAPSQAITNIDSIRSVEDSFIDNWESYPRQRNMIVDSIRLKAINNVVFVTGDSHCSWSFDVTSLPCYYLFPETYYLPQPFPYNPVTGMGYTDSSHAGSWAVEFGTPSISSPNFDELGFPPATIAQFEYSLKNNIPIPNVGMVNYNPHLEYVDLKNHGYFILDLSKDSAQANYYYVPSIVQKGTNIAFSKGVAVKYNQNFISNTSATESPIGMESIPAPFNQNLVTGLQENQSQNVFISLYPNPTQDILLLNFASLEEGKVSINIYSATGKYIRTLVKSQEIAGVYQSAYDVSDLESGTYIIKIETKNSQVSRKFVKQ